MTQISTKEQFINLLQGNSTIDNFYLTDNIDLQNSPINSNINPIKYNLNGNNFTIKNINITSATLFSDISTGYLFSNIIFDTFNAPLFNNNYGQIVNCKFFNGNLQNKYAAIIAGSNGSNIINNSIIENCVFQNININSTSGILDSAILCRRNYGIIRKCVFDTVNVTATTTACIVAITNYNEINKCVLNDFNVKSTNSYSTAISTFLQTFTNSLGESVYSKILNCNLTYSNINRTTINGNRTSSIFGRSYNSSNIVGCINIYNQIWISGSNRTYGYNLDGLPNRYNITLNNINTVESTNDTNITCEFFDYSNIFKPMRGYDIINNIEWIYNTEYNGAQLVYIKPNNNILTIPSSIQITPTLSYPVYVIGNNIPLVGFAFNQELTITISDGIKAIYTSALSSLKTQSIILPDSLEYIGNRAFSDPQFSSIIIPQNVKYIGDGAFSAEYSTIQYLRNITFTGTELPQIIGEPFRQLINTYVYFTNAPTPSGTTWNGLIILQKTTPPTTTTPTTTTIPTTTTTTPTTTTIPTTMQALAPTTTGIIYNTDFVTDNTFKLLAYNGTNADIIIPKYITSLNYVFKNNIKITSIKFEIGNTINELLPGEFSKCTNLTSIILPPSIKYIYNTVFEYCNKLRTIIFSEGLLSIEYNTFFGCASLNNIILPNSLTSIGNNVFMGCNSLTAINIPQNISSIGNLCFVNCDSLNSILVNNLNEHYKSIDGVLFNKSEDNLIICPANKTGIYNIPNTTTNIGSYAFNRSKLNNIIITENVKYINSHAFDDCLSIYNIIIPSNVIYIAEYAFMKSRLNNITINNGVIDIGNGAFSDCSNLTSITLPNTINRIRYKLFDSCLSLLDIIIP